MGGSRINSGCSLINSSPAEAGLFHFLKIPMKFRSTPTKMEQPQMRGTSTQKPNSMVLEGPNQQVRDEAKRNEQSGL